MVGDKQTQVSKQVWRWSGLSSREVHADSRLLVRTRSSTSASARSVHGLPATPSAYLKHGPGHLRTTSDPEEGALALDL